MSDLPEHLPDPCGPELPSPWMHGMAKAFVRRNRSSGRETGRNSKAISRQVTDFGFSQALFKDLTPMDLQ